MPPEFPRNANISITIDTEGRPPFILPTIFSRRVSNSFGETSRNFMHPRIVPLLSDRVTIFFFTIFTALYSLSKKEKKRKIDEEKEAFRSNVRARYTISERVGQCGVAKYQHSKWKKIWHNKGGGGGGKVEFVNEARHFGRRGKT